MQNTWKFVFVISSEFLGSTLKKKTGACAPMCIFELSHSCSQVHTWIVAVSRMTIFSAHLRYKVIWILMNSPYEENFILYHCQVRVTEGKFQQKC